MTKVAYWNSDSGSMLERDATPEEEDEITGRSNKPPTEAEYIAALEAMFNAKAAERRYSSRLTCTLRAGYPGPFQAEGQAFALWMDTCNMTAYGIMRKVIKGEIPQPTVAEVVAAMPTLTWPAQVY